MVSNAKLDENSVVLVFMSEFGGFQNEEALARTKFQEFVAMATEYNPGMDVPARERRGSGSYRNRWHPVILRTLRSSYLSIDMPCCDLVMM